MSANPEPDPFDSPEYAAFVESMAPHCHCASILRPCAGVLAGGICDGMTERDILEAADACNSLDDHYEQWGDGGLIELDST